MANLFFQGTHTALITPFTSDGVVDYEALTALIQKQIDANIDGLVILGTTGESPAITHEEFQHIVEHAVRTAQGQTKITVGVGSNDTQKTVTYAQEAEELGADAVMVVNPYYNKPTQEGLYQHFSTVADAISVPVLVYNIKGRTAVNVETSTLRRLAEHPNIQGVKEASGDIHQIMDVLQQMPENFAVLAGDDSMTYPVITLGGHGVVSVLSNVVPERMKNMVDAGLAGDLPAAREQYYQLLPLMAGCFIETNPIPIKTALVLQGMATESFRLPMCPMEPSNKQQWKSILEANHVL